MLSFLISCVDSSQSGCVGCFPGGWENAFGVKILLFYLLESWNICFWLWDSPDKTKVNLFLHCLCAHIEFDLWKPILVCSLFWFSGNEHTVFFHQWMSSSVKLYYMSLRISQVCLVYYYPHVTDCLTPTSQNGNSWGCNV